MRKLSYFACWNSKLDKLAYYFIYSVDDKVFDKGIRHDRPDFFEYIGMLTVRHTDRDLKVVLDEGIVDILENENAELS
ncbi:hypothetical protein HYT23_02915 [Candidatus Pacearchaeota archaeon]|nr:hypothetical protein [Candidatus Pacearchaeota archaeon]